MNRKQFLKGMAGAAAVTALCSMGVSDKYAVSEERDQMEDKIQDILDREAIKECQYRYARGCDWKDVQMLSSSFDDTITVDYPTGTSMKDVPGTRMAEGIVGNFVKNGIVTQHYMNVYEIVIQGDTASALVYLRATHKKEGEDFWVLGGYYENTYIRTPNGWKIKTVRLTTQYEEGKSYV